MFCQLLFFDLIYIITGCCWYQVDWWLVGLVSQCHTAHTKIAKHISLIKIFVLAWNDRTHRYRYTVNV